MNITERRTRIILGHLQDKHNLEYCSHYGEPGYQDPETGILFANWNPISQTICDYLEEAGYEMEWSDEWYVDYDNDKAYRTSPDSYGWQCQIMFTEQGDVLTPDDSIDEWIEEMKMWDKGHTPQVLPGWITEADLEDRGFVQYGEHFETGLHPGQNDDPKKVAEIIFEKQGVEDVIFRIERVGQFDLYWQAWYRGENIIRWEDNDNDNEIKEAA